MTDHRPGPTTQPDPCPAHSKWGNRLDCPACGDLRRQLYADLATSEADPTDQTPAPTARPDPAEQLLRHIDPGMVGPLHAVAEAVLAALPPSAERTSGMRKLVQASDCFARAMRDVDRDVTPAPPQCAASGSSGRTYSNAGEHATLHACVYTQPCTFSCALVDGVARG